MGHPALGCGFSFCAFLFLRGMIGGGEAFAERVHDVDDFGAWLRGLGLGEGFAFSFRVDEFYDGGFVVVLVGGEVELRSAGVDELLREVEFLRVD